MLIFSFAAFHSNGTPTEPKTPSSPCDQPVYLDLTDKVNEIPEVSEKSEDPANNVESSFSTKTPLPPAAPGMCIPTDYVNVAPVNEGSINAQPPDTRVWSEKPASVVETPSETRHQSEIPAGDTENSKKAVAGHDVAGNSEEYVRADSIEDNNSSIGVDVTDSPRLPEYMNIGVPSEQEIARIVGALPKKMPAPPVPPRGDSSLAR